MGILCFKCNNKYATYPVFHRGPRKGFFCFWYTLIMKARTIRAWAIKKNNKLSAREVYFDRPVTLLKGEKLVRVIISEV